MYQVDLVLTLTARPKGRTRPNIEEYVTDAVSIHPEANQQLLPLAPSENRTINLGSISSAALVCLVSSRAILISLNGGPALTASALLLNGATVTAISLTNPNTTSVDVRLIALGA